MAQNRISPEDIKKMKEIMAGRSTMKTMSYLSVGIEVAGMHRYPESTRVYLRDFHRHDYKVSVVIGVSDQNRQFEFYDVQDSMRLALDSLFTRVDVNTYNFGNRSCEHIANELIVVLSEKYPIESVSVFEDEYNGSVVVNAQQVATNVKNGFEGDSEFRTPTLNMSFGPGSMVGKNPKSLF